MLSRRRLSCALGVCTDLGLQQRFGSSTGNRAGLKALQGTASSDDSGFPPASRGRVPTLRQGPPCRRAHPRRAGTVHSPERWGDTLYWRGCLTALVGDLDGALRLLKEAVDRGHWWSGGSLRGDPDLKVLQGDPQFEALVSVCRQRHAQAETSARPELLRLRPGTDPPWPLLMALHGAGGDAEEFSPHWQRATAEGWLVGIPQSSQMIAPGRFGWADQDRAAQEIRGHYQTIIRECRVDPGRVIMAGFSQVAAGAWISGRRLRALRPGQSASGH